MLAAAMPSAGYAYATLKAALVAAIVAILVKMLFIAITPRLIEMMQISIHQTTLSLR
ncbi:MAG: hypothetical protein V7K50_19095 [Nostoc sp.]|uniref:hypothetical protein n=1 Tax=Nostoc sp. TaxID=1180 RepID=UPI002FFC0BD2